MKNEIRVIGAYANNLKSVSTSIPLYRDTVVIGVSGSGKTSLVYDVLYKKSQVEFLQHMPELWNQPVNPVKVKTVENIPASLSLSQTSYNSNPRSTVGTFSGISRLLRTFYAMNASLLSGETFRPNDFSFNNPKSYCKSCQGKGYVYDIDLTSVVPNENLTLNEGAIGWFDSTHTNLSEKILDKICEEYAIPMDIEYRNLTDKQKKVLLYNDPTKKHLIRYKVGKKYRSKTLSLKGAIISISEYLRDLNRPSSRQKIEKYLMKIECNECLGDRLIPDMLKFRVCELNISNFERMSFNKLDNWICTNYSTIKGINEEASQYLIKIQRLIRNFIEVGLGYLNLNRIIPTLSGGEMQRVRLATILNGSLTGILYILDEPCQGLHNKDIPPVISAVKKLTAAGNTVISIEHNIQFIRNSSNILALGPGSGKKGGEVCDEQLLLKELSREWPMVQSSLSHNTKFTRVSDININNLKDLNINLPNKSITAIVGPSGSGKSSLLRFIRDLTRHKLPDFKKIYMIDQKPVSKNIRSIVATYLGVFDEIRRVFAGVQQAQEEHMSISHFSSNTKEGMCLECEGLGEKELDVTYLDKLSVRCEVCNGSGYNDEVLSILYKGRNISEVLDLTIDEAIKVFEDYQSLTRTLNLMKDLGMAYIKLGQRTGTLSGGEAQRLKLSKVLGKKKVVGSLFLLDEPSAGLSLKDIEFLSHLLIDASVENTIVIVDHNLEFVKMTANYIVELDPKDYEESCVKFEGETRYWLNT